MHCISILRHDTELDLVYLLLCKPRDLGYFLCPVYLTNKIGGRKYGTQDQADWLIREWILEPPGFQLSAPGTRAPYACRASYCSCYRICGSASQGRPWLGQPKFVFGNVQDLSPARCSLSYAICLELLAPTADFFCTSWEGDKVLMSVF